MKKRISTILNKKVKEKPDVSSITAKKSKLQDAKKIFHQTMTAS